MSKKIKSASKVISTLLAIVVFIFWGSQSMATNEPPTHHEQTEQTADGDQGGHGGHTKHLENLWSFNYGDGKLYNNPPFLFGVFNFVLLIILLVKFTRKPVGNFLKERHEQVQRELTEASELKNRAQQRLSEIEGRLSNLDKEIAALKEAVAQDAEEEKQRLIEAAEIEAQRIVANADRTMEREIDRIRRRLELETVNASMAAAKTILQKQINDGDRKRLHDEYFDQLTTGEGGN
ncbi:MAG: ATP synthase F0 subunit B [Pseudomonadota bacterium]